MRLFLKGSAGAAGDLTKGFVTNVAESIKSGAASAQECPVCLDDTIEDPVVTPCGHVMCRECLLSALQHTRAAVGGTKGEGMCPVCRHVLSKDDLLTMPSENRFTVDVEVRLTDIYIHE